MSNNDSSSATSSQQSSSLSSSVVPTSIIPHDNQDSSIQEFMFEITLNSSDVVKDANHVVIPNHHAEKYFPSPGVHLEFVDESGQKWKFRYSYWPPNRIYVFTKGWSKYVQDKKLETDDVVQFLRLLSDSRRFFIRYRRKGSFDQNNNNDNQNQSVLQSSLEHTDGEEEQRRRKRKRNNGGIIIKDNNNDDIHPSTNTTNTNTSVEDESSASHDLSLLKFDPDPSDFPPFPWYEQEFNPQKIYGYSDSPSIQELEQLISSSIAKPVSNNEEQVQGSVPPPPPPPLQQSTSVGHLSSQGFSTSSSQLQGSASSYLQQGSGSPTNNDQTNN